MNFNNLLNQVLGSVKSAGQQLGQSDDTAGTITKVGGGAAAIGVLSMLLGRSGGSSLAKVGSLAALGSLAYQAYQNYQRNQAGSADTPSELPTSAFEPTAQAAEDASRVILRTMVAVAAADGVIDEQEKQAILAEGGSDPAIQQWLEQEMAQPATTDEIARMVGDNPALAAEVYLAARMVCADLSRKEIVFLSRLAQALKLDDQLIEQLEKQAGF